jgi:nicotinate phosphoribosyltransferase
LVTCQAQPSLGCVYKLVELNGRPRIKLSQDVSKVIIPGKKQPYRLYGHDRCPILDLLVGTLPEESTDTHPPTPPEIPLPGHRILCRHPFISRKRAAVTPSRVEALHVCVFRNGRVVEGANRTLLEARTAVRMQLQTLRPDMVRYTNPTPYKVSVTEGLYQFLHDLWLHETPVAELK